MRTLPIIVTMACVGASVCLGNVLHVPSEYATIQSAFDNVSEGDTVLVGLGEYYEGLISPSLTFSLVGDVSPDTGDYPRPLIDVSVSPDSLDLPCLTASAGSDLTVERFRFRTRLHSDTTRPNIGGIYVQSTHIRIVDCLFDSTQQSVQQQQWISGALELERCHFKNNPTYGPYAISPYGAVIAHQCRFEGRSGWQLVGEWGTRVTECVFWDNPGGTFLDTYGSDIEIRDCTFGPGVPSLAHAIILDSFGGVFANNVITDLDFGASVMEIHVDSSDQCEITGNRFVRLNWTQGGGLTGPMRIYGGEVGSSIPPFLITDNAFVACSTFFGVKAIYFRGMGSVIGNRFISNRPTGLQYMATLIGDAADHALVRGNLFFDNGSGADTWTAWSGRLDARWNWWGDSTGPYNPSLNPEGLGDAVGDSVLFEPWLPDSNITSAPEPALPLPSAFKLEVYPNPFNPDTRLKFTVPEKGQYRIELFDIRGRKVRGLLEGAVVIDREIAFNAADLPSGVYFARALQSATHRSVAAAKLVLLR